MSSELLEAPKTESSVIAKYKITKAEIQKAVETASLIVVNGPDDKQGMALARESRLSLQKMRTAIEAKRKDLKADALAYGKKVDAVAKELTAIISPEEQRLKELEETAAREAERQAAVEKQQRETEMRLRCEALSAIGVMVPVIELQFLDDGAFGAFYTEKKAAFDAAKKAEEEAEAARKAESERLAKVAAEQAAQAAEIARQQEELAKKQAEIEAKERAIRAQEEAARTASLRHRVSVDAYLSSQIAQIPQDLIDKFEASGFCPSDAIRGQLETGTAWNTLDIEHDPGSESHYSTTAMYYVCHWNGNVQRAETPWGEMSGKADGEFIKAVVDWFQSMTQAKINSN